MSTGTELSELSNAVVNKTNITIITDSFVNYMDSIMRVVSLLVYIAYFISIAFIKSLQTRHLLFLHNVNLAGFIYILHYVAYISSQSPTTSDRHLNEIMCYLSGMLWLIVNFSRTFSVLLVAAYRYCAVYHINFFKSFNKSRLQMLMSVLATWLFSIILSFILRYSFPTKYSVFYCFVGDSPHMDIVISFMVTNCFLSIVVPTLITLVLYIRILQRIHQINISLTRIKKPSLSKNPGWFFNKVIPRIVKPRIDESQSTLETSVSGRVGSNNSSNGFGPGYNKESRSRQKLLALQFIMINGINILGSVFSVLINISLNIATSDGGRNLGSLETFQYLRPIFRILFILIQTLIPPLSLINRPWRYKIK